jgi:tyrosine-protein kinase Etk/Wzc
MEQQEALPPPTVQPLKADKVPIGIGDETEAGEIDLLTFARVLLRGRRTILRIALVAASLGAALVILMRPVYTAEAVFLPPGSLNGGSSLSAQLGAIGALTGSAGSALGALKNPGYIYIGILGSRTIADRMVQHFDLQKLYHAKKLSDARKKLAANTKFVAGKESSITISVTDHTSQRSADMANAYVHELTMQNDHLALTESAQRRLFFEQQLVREKDALADAEVDLRKTEERTGLIDPYGQAQMEIGSIAQIRAEMASRDVQLSALRGAATEHNPDVIRLRREMSDLQRQLKHLENSASTANRPGNVVVPTSRVPSISLEYVRKLREVKYHESLFDMISKQYEAARLDESHSAPLLQVVDVAVPPDTESGPHRLLIILLAFLGGLLIGSVWILGRWAYGTMPTDSAKS